ncbi:MAG: FHA domain-containing protein [Candidatus Velthaea sp.]
MNVIARIELVCARFVEEGFARIFPSALDSAQVGRKLVAALHATPSDMYLVRVHPDDYRRFEVDRDFLEARWSALLRDAAGDAKNEAPRALLHEDPHVVAGSVAIEAVVDDRPQVFALQRADGTRVALRDGLWIGRADDNDVIVADARVSRHHARVVGDGEAFAIEDAGSSNGTFVDGRAARRERLTAGSIVTVGDTYLRVVTDAG